jgi:hypothetical protein
MDERERNRWRRHHAQLTDLALGEKLDADGNWRLPPVPFFTDVMQTIDELIGRAAQLEAELADCKAEQRQNGCGSSSVGGGYAEAVARHEKLSSWP